MSIAEITFKELYVATSEESVFFDRASNAWSRSHQVPLALAVAALRARGWSIASTLPWGSPIFRGALDGHALQVAAYTEPTVLWERAHGLSRSWNLMADGRCYASLEDRASELA